MEHFANLVARIPRLAEARVACVGDMILDQYIYGSVERISPEAPIPVLRVTRETSTLGGVGNVARNLSALGATCAVLTAIGDDEAGQRIQELLKALPLIHAELLSDISRKTTIKSRCIASSQQMVRIDRESLNDLAPAAVRQLLASVRATLGNCHVLILSDYGKGVLTRGLTADLIKSARESRLLTIVDPKGSDYSRYHGASILTPNRFELAQATGLPVDDDESLIAAASRLIQMYDLDAVLATRSEQGMTLVTRDGCSSHLPAEAREVFDVSGAGDTVVAVLAAGLAVGMSLLDSARLANAAAGIVVGKVGTAAVRPEELVQALRTQKSPSSLDKILCRDRVTEMADRWRVEGLKIGFTNGCFDLLHPGHISLLAQAAAKCDRLIVGLNSDDSVKRLKGPDRPVQNELSRATVLAFLETVDAVAVFEEDTPQTLIEQIRPDLLVKGADYSIENVVGADFVKSFGGEVLLVTLVPYQSTTRILRRMQET